MDRPKNRASAKQLALIRAEWAKISNQRSEKDRELALLKICKKVAGVDMLEWMSAAQTNKLIAALRKWRKSEAA
jgi:hypothetical protein